MRWLQGTNFDDSQPSSPDAARCLLAIREARTALAKNPDDPDAYRLLDIAYRILTMQETALLAGIPLTPENQPRVNMLVPNLEVLNTRFRQRVTALNFAIQTTPPPRTAEGRRELASLNLELFQLFLQAGCVDLVRDRLALVLDQSQPGDFTAEVRSQYAQQLDQLNQRVKQIEDNLLDLQVERQASPIEKAQYARSQGAVGLAIGELEEADRGNMAPLDRQAAARGALLLHRPARPGPRAACRGRRRRSQHVHRARAFLDPARASLHAAGELPVRRDPVAGSGHSQSAIGT